MNRLVFAGLLVIVALSFMPMVNAAETKCKGDAARATPPIPNYPHHIRNVVWRNTRAMCLEELSRTTKPQATSDTLSTQPPSSK